MNRNKTAARVRQEQRTYETIDRIIDEIIQCSHINERGSKTIDKHYYEVIDEITAELFALITKKKRGRRSAPRT